MLLSSPSSSGEHSAFSSLGPEGRNNRQNGIVVVKAGAARQLRDPSEVDRLRQEEMEYIKQNDGNDADVWFLVDARWLHDWRDFIRKKADMPGPIDNSRLVDGRTGAPMPNLNIIEDYRGVNASMWTFWHQRYGGGPEVRRKTLDLYGLPVSESEAAYKRQTADLENTMIVARIQKAVAQEEEKRLVQEKRAKAAAEATKARETTPRKGGDAKDTTPRRGRAPARSSTDQAPKRGSSVPGPEAKQGEASELDQTRIIARPKGVAAIEKGSATAKARAGTRSGSDLSSKRGISVPARKSLQSKAAGKGVTCDKCDGPHETDSCPHFKKVREKHKDAWSMLGKASSVAGKKDEIVKVSHARVVPQPGDGSCLFHSLSYGLKDTTGPQLRKEICEFISSNPDLEIGDNALKDWVKYDGGGNVQSYIKRMAKGTWGGGIEMAVCTRLRRVNVHVYEKCSGGFRRISAFENEAALKTVNVLYCGRAHYDALVL